jgi:hypothetical protein
LLFPVHGALIAPQAASDDDMVSRWLGNYRSANTRAPLPSVGASSILTIGATHLLALSRLPMHHRDPFDHLLIAQAIAEDATFISDDRNTSRYSVRSITCSSA